MSTSEFTTYVDFNGTLYSVYDQADKLVEATPSRERAEALVQKIASGEPLQFDEDGLL